MELNFPLGWLSRLWNSVRSKPCRVELVRVFGSSGEWQIRIRNDTPFPVVVSNVEFYERPNKKTDWSYAHYPLNWLFEVEFPKEIQPGKTLKGVIRKDEFEDGWEYCKLYVYHDRYTQPEKFIFKRSQLKP